MTNPRTAPALLAGLAVVAATLPAAASAQEPGPEVLKRTTKWEARFDPGACHLVTRFGEGNAAILALFTRDRLGDGFNLNLVGARLGNSHPQENVRLDFGNQAVTREGVTLANWGDTPAFLLRGVRLDGRELENNPAPPPIAPEQEAAVSGLTVTIGNVPPFRLETGSLGKPFAMLRTCVNSLVKSWGYDPAVQEKLSRRANPASPLKVGSEYPAKAFKQRREAMLEFRLDIDAEGKVVGCSILDRPASDEFGAVTCRNFSRTPFHPALDAEGRPVASYFFGRTRFALP